MTPTEALRSAMQAAQSVGRIDVDLAVAHLRKNGYALHAISPSSVGTPLSYYHEMLPEGPCESYNEDLKQWLKATIIETDQTSFPYRVRFAHSVNTSSWKRASMVRPVPGAES